MGGRNGGNFEAVSRCFGSVEVMKLFYVLVTIVFWLANFINIVHYVSCVDVELYKKLFFCVKVFPYDGCFGGSADGYRGYGRGMFLRR